MAAKYYLYNTNFGNTIVDRSNISFSPLPPYDEIYIDYFIPEIQPLYLYRESGGIIIENTQENINDYLNSIAPPPTPEDNVTYGEFTGRTDDLQTQITNINIEIGTLATYSQLTGATSCLQNQINILSGETFTGVTLQEVTEVGGITNIETTFNGGLVTGKIRPTGDTVNAIQFRKANGITPVINIDTVSGLTGFGIITPTAVIHLKSGTTINAPLKFTNGDLLSIPQIGAVEFSGDKFYGTISGNTRKTFAFLESPIFTGAPELPVNTTLSGVNLYNFIWYSGGTENICKVNTNTFNSYTASTASYHEKVVTGATNGLSKADCHRVKLGGNLTENTIISGEYDFCLSGKRIDIATSAGGQIYDKNGCGIELYSSGGTVTIKGMTSAGTESMRLQISNTQITFTDYRVTPRGIEYAGNYSSTYTNRSLVDKEYVDSIASSIIPKTAVDVATTENIVLSGLTTIDGVSLTNGMRVLVKNQTSGQTNGVYIATGGTWQRSSDFNENNEVVHGSYFFVLSGNTNKNTSWILQTPNPIEVGVTSLAFQIFSAQQGVTQGNGICIQTIGGNYNVSVKLANNCGLCSDVSGLYINSAIAGTGLNYTAGVLSVCGLSLAGNSICWSGNTFNVDVNSGSLSNALNSKLNVSTFNSYTGNTAALINNKLDTSIYQQYTGTTAPATYLAKSAFNTYTGTTAPATYLAKSAFNTYSGTTVPATYLAKSAFNTYTGTTAPATYLAKSAFNTYSGNTETLINSKADINSPTFTGIPSAPTAAVNTNTAQIATTAFVVGQAANTTPLMDGSATIGTSLRYARQDHVHPVDTSRVAKTGDTMTGDLLFTGAVKRSIKRSTNDGSLSLYGGTSEASGAYFQITGTGHTASPYGGSAEFVIRNLAQSQFTLFSYDGVSTWTPRFSIAGSSGLVNINNELSIGGATTGTTLYLSTTPPSASIQQPTLFWDATTKQIKAYRLTGGSDQYFYSECTTNRTTTNITCVKAHGLTGTTLAGRYEVTFSAEFGNAISNACTLGAFKIDNVTQGTNILMRMQVGNYDVFNTFTRDVTLTAGTHCFVIWFWNSGGTACVPISTIRVKRIG